METGNNQRPLRAFLKALLVAWRDDRPNRLAAALAYYAMFSFAPILFFAITVAGLLVDELEASSRVYGQLAQAVGQDGVKFIQTAVEGTTRLRSGHTLLASIIGIAILFIIASEFFAQFDQALNIIWHVPARSYSNIGAMIKIRLTAFVMVVGVGVLLSVLTFLSIAASVLSSFLHLKFVVSYVNPLALLVITAFSLALIYKVMPQPRIEWRDVWPGAAITALILVVGGQLVGLYFRLVNVASAFGAAGALVVVLISTFYAILIVLFGALFTRVYAFTFGSRKGQHLLPVEQVKADTVNVADAG
jgi:membrane protein